MRAEIISIGDELTSGQRLDTNSQWLSQRLGELGIATAFHSTVGDDLEQNVEVFRTAVARGDVVISTGGLGPTADDLTREALAKLVDKPLVRDDASLEHIRALFARRQRPMPERNVVQAMFPQGSRPIPNPYGTAPGIAIDVPRGGGVSHVYALPGVPAEMFEMWEATVAPALVALSGRPSVIRHHCVRCFGIGESDLEAMLPDLIRRGRTPTVGITVSDATITLRITAQADSAEGCAAQIAATVTTIRECLGDLVYGEVEDELGDVVLRLLLERGETLATVEWGNAGLAWSMHQAAERAVQGFPADAAQRMRTCYSAGLTLGAPAAAERQLGDAAPWETLAPSGREMVTSLAEQGRRALRADWCLATAAYPDFATSGEPNRFWMAIAHGAAVVAQSVPYTGHPAILKPRAAKQALNFLRLQLLAKG